MAEKKKKHLLAILGEPLKRTKRLSGNKNTDKMLKTLEKKKKKPSKK
jgi:hypothetical protein